MTRNRRSPSPGGTASGVDPSTAWVSMFWTPARQLLIVISRNEANVAG